MGRVELRYLEYFDDLDISIPEMFRDAGVFLYLSCSVLLALGRSEEQVIFPKIP